MAFDLNFAVEPDKAAYLCCRKCGRLPWKVLFCDACAAISCDQGCISQDDPCDVCGKEKMINESAKFSGIAQATLVKCPEICGAVFPFRKIEDHME